MVSSAPPSKVYPGTISHVKFRRTESPPGNRVGTEATDVKHLAGALHMEGQSMSALFCLTSAMIRAEAPGPPPRER